MKYTQLTTEQEIVDLIGWHNAHSDYCILDIETTGLDPFTDRITDIVLSGMEEHSAVIFDGAFTPLLSRLATPIVCHNFKFDFNFMFRNGVDLRRAGLHADTMLLDHLLDENKEHGLDKIVQRRYKDSYKEVFWSTYTEYTLAPKEEQVAYACKDVIYTGMLYEDLKRDLQGKEDLIEHVHSLAKVLYDTEIRGIKLDLIYLKDLAENIGGLISALLIKMREQVEMQCSIIENEGYLEEYLLKKTDKGKANVKKTPFNFDSNKQLAKLFYERLRLPVQLSKTRKPTVDDAALAKLEKMHTVVGLLREYRGLQKVYTSFIEGSLNKQREGKIYPSFNVNGTVTGRISSSSPNLQQLPREGGVRGIYTPEQGYKLLSCDYSQLEVTIAAHFSRDANLLKIVYEGASQHDITAKGLGIDRQKAKTINFAMQYGAGVHKIASILNCNMKDAELALNKYWETYKGLAQLIKRCHEQVVAGKSIVNPYGRERRFPTQFTDKWELESAKRQSFSSLIQGTGADITSEALYNADYCIREDEAGRALFSVHDELLVEIQDNACERYQTMLPSIMEQVGKRIGLSVPLKAECSKPMERWSK